jgi:hypothetical protein
VAADMTSQDLPQGAAGSSPDACVGSSLDPGADASSDPGADIAEALAALDRLEDRPTSGHVAAFERVHRTLTDALSAIDGV